MSPPAKHLRRKDLRQPDEFMTVTGQVIEWARQNQRLLEIAAVAALGVILLAGGIRWYLGYRETRAAQDFYAADQLFKREQWDAARESFAALSEKLGRTAHGRLASLYAGHAALRGDRPGEAVTYYRAFLDRAPSSDAIRQIAQLALARALEATGDLDDARQSLQTAIDHDGPAQADALLALAQLEESAEARDRARELYERYLKEFPEAVSRDLARAAVVKLGGKLPDEPQPFAAGGAEGLQVVPSFGGNDLGDEEGEE